MYLLVFLSLFLVTDLPCIWFVGFFFAFSLIYLHQGLLSVWRLNCSQPLPLNQRVNTTLSDGGVLDILRCQPIYKVCIGNYRGPVSFTLHLPPDAIKPRRVESRREKEVFIKPTALHSWNGQHPVFFPYFLPPSPPLPLFRNTEAANPVKYNLWCRRPAHALQQYALTQSDLHK